MVNVKHELQLPTELAEFLESSKSLEYDPTLVDCGELSLRSSDALELIHIRAVTENSLFDDEHEDPYEIFDGGYGVDVVPLFVENMTLVWIPYLQMFGSFDEEHANLVVFTSAKWSDIVSDPVSYLGVIFGEVSDPPATSAHWLFLPFYVEELSPEAVIEAYAELCLAHNTKLKTKTWDAFDEEERSLATTYPAEYVTSLIADFPCRGIPDCSGQLIYCPSCEEAMNQWKQNILSQEEISDPISLRMNKVGWVNCNCGARFRLTNKFTEDRDGQRFLKDSIIKCHECRSTIQIENADDPIESPFE